MFIKEISHTCRLLRWCTIQLENDVIIPDSLIPWSVYTAVVYVTIMEKKKLTIAHVVEGFVRGNRIIIVGDSRLVFFLSSSDATKDAPCIGLMHVKSAEVQSFHVGSGATPVLSCAAPLQTEARWVGVKVSTFNARRDPKCPLARHLRMVRENTGVPNEGAICAWIAADETVGCTRTFLTMWRSSRRLVCRGHPEPDLRVNDISWIQWSQHLLTTQSERLN
ncbi:uncharacterized protein TNCV_1226361 [Trichonephila clavipes]|nr:uncharacterized protein TNCV_1226361 [Trichonephila clavipes]